MKKIVLYSFVGLIAGFINGFFGTGGAIPLLALFAFGGQHTQKALATSSFCVMILSAVSFIFYLKNGTLSVSFLPDFIKGSLLPAAVGGAVGSLLLSRLTPDLLKKIFFAVTVIGGIGTVFK